MDKWSTFLFRLQFIRYAMFVVLVLYLLFDYLHDPAVPNDLERSCRAPILCVVSDTRMYG